MERRIINRTPRSQSLLKLRIIYGKVGNLIPPKGSGNFPGFN